MRIFHKILVRFSQNVLSCLDGYWWKHIRWISEVPGKSSKSSFAYRPTGIQPLEKAKSSRISGKLIWLTRIWRLDIIELLDETKNDRPSAMLMLILDAKNFSDAIFVEFDPLMVTRIRFPAKFFECKTCGESCSKSKTPLLFPIITAFRF